MPEDHTPSQPVEHCDEGDVHYIVGPARLPNGRRREARDRADDCQLLKLALIASDYGRTTFVDSYGGAVIFGGGPETETDAELF